MSEERKSVAELTVAHRAKSFAWKKHDGQKRRGGEDYFYHLDRVVNRLSMESDTVHAVGWLHDVVEDTDTGLCELAEHFPHEVVDAVFILTRGDGETYETYLERIKANPIARKVKIADMLDNLTDRPTEQQVKRYCKGILFLME